MSPCSIDTCVYPKYSNYDNLEGDLILIGHLSRKRIYCLLRTSDHMKHPNGPHDKLYYMNNFYVQSECSGLKHLKNIDAEPGSLSVTNFFVNFVF